LTWLEATHKLIIRETGETFVSRCYRALTSWERMRGLLGCKGLEPGEGLLIEHCSSIHMFFMRFAIDVVYIDAKWQVVKKVNHLVPWRLSGCLRARHTLELPADALKRAELPLGCHLDLREAG